MNNVGHPQRFPIEEKYGAIREVRNASSCPMRVVMQRLKTADKAAPVADLAYLPANASDVIEVRQDQLKTGHIWWKWADERYTCDAGLNVFSVKQIR